MNSLLLSIAREDEPSLPCVKVTSSFDAGHVARKQFDSLLYFMAATSISTTIGMHIILIYVLH